MRMNQTSMKKLHQAIQEQIEDRIKTEDWTDKDLLLISDEMYESFIFNNLEKFEDRIHKNLDFLEEDKQLETVLGLIVSSFKKKHLLEKLALDNSRIIIGAEDIQSQLEVEEWRNLFHKSANDTHTASRIWKDHVHNLVIRDFILFPLPREKGEEYRYIITKLGLFILFRKYLVLSDFQDFYSFELTKLVGRKEDINKLTKMFGWFDKKQKLKTAKNFLVYSKQNGLGKTSLFDKLLETKEIKSGDHSFFYFNSRNIKSKGFQFTSTNFKLDKDKIDNLFSSSNFVEYVKILEKLNKESKELFIILDQCERFFETTEKNILNLNETIFNNIIQGDSFIHFIFVTSDFYRFKSWWQENIEDRLNEKYQESLLIKERIVDGVKNRYRIDFNKEFKERLEFLSYWLSNVGTYIKLQTLLKNSDNVLSSILIQEDNDIQSKEIIPYNFKFYLKCLYDLLDYTSAENKDNEVIDIIVDGGPDIVFSLWLSNIKEKLSKIQNRLFEEIIKELFITREQISKSAFRETVIEQEQFDFLINLLEDYRLIKPRGTDLFEFSHDKLLDLFYQNLVKLTREEEEQLKLLKKHVTLLRNHFEIPDHDEQEEVIPNINKLKKCFSESDQFFVDLLALIYPKNIYISLDQEEDLNLSKLYHSIKHLNINYQDLGLRLINHYKARKEDFSKNNRKNFDFICSCIIEYGSQTNQLEIFNQNFNILLEMLSVSSILGAETFKQFLQNSEIIIHLSNSVKFSTPITAYLEDVNTKIILKTDNERKRTRLFEFQFALFSEIYENLLYEGSSSEWRKIIFELLLKLGLQLGHIAPDEFSIVQESKSLVPVLVKIHYAIHRDIEHESWSDFEPYINNEILFSLMENFSISMWQYMPIEEVEEERIKEILLQKLEKASVRELIQIATLYHTFVSKNENYDELVLKELLSNKSEMLCLFYKNEHFWENLPEPFHQKIIDEIRQINDQLLDLLENPDDVNRDFIPYTYMNDNTKLKFIEYITLLKKIEYSIFQELFYSILKMPCLTNSVRDFIADFLKTIMNEDTMNLVTLIEFLHAGSDVVIHNFSASTSARELEEVDSFYQRMLELSNDEESINKLSKISSRFIENLKLKVEKYYELEDLSSLLLAFKIRILTKKLRIISNKNQDKVISLIYEELKGFLSYDIPVHYKRNFVMDNFLSFHNVLAELILGLEEKQIEDLRFEQFLELLLRLHDNESNFRWVSPDQEKQWVALLVDLIIKTGNENRIFDMILIEEQSEEQRLSLKLLLKTAFQINKERTKKILFSSFENGSKQCLLKFVDTNDFDYFENEDLKTIKDYIVDNLIEILDRNEIDFYTLGLYNGFENLKLNRKERFKIINKLKKTKHESLIDYFFRESFQDFKFFVDIIEEIDVKLYDSIVGSEDNHRLHIPNKISNYISKNNKAIEFLERRLYGEENINHFENLLILYYENIMNTIRFKGSEEKLFNISLIFNLIREKDVSFHTLLFLFLNDIVVRRDSDLELKDIFSQSENYEKFLEIIDIHVLRAEIDLTEILRTILFRSSLAFEDDSKIAILKLKQVRELLYKCSEIILKTNDFSHPVRFKFLHFALERMYRHSFQADTSFILKINEIRKGFEIIVSNLELSDEEGDTTFKAGYREIELREEKGILRVIYDYLNLINSLNIIDDIVGNLIDQLIALEESVRKQIIEQYRNYELNFIEVKEYQPILTPIFKENPLMELQFKWLTSEYIYIINERNINTDRNKEFVDNLFFKVKSLLTSENEITRILMCDILNRLSRDIKSYQFDELSKSIIECKKNYPLHQLTIIFWRFRELLELICSNTELLYRAEWGLKLIKRVNSRFGSIEILKKRLEKSELRGIRNLKFIK